MGTMNYFKWMIAVAGLLYTGQILAQGGTVYEDRILDDKIKSVQMYIGNQPAMIPIIGFNSGFRKFTLRFDELSDDANEFFYRVIHCDRNWKASDLEEIEYLDGYNGEEIQDYQFSTNTYVDYVHFSLTLPNEDTRFRISGNYILIIYDDEQMTNPVITRRFIVNEDKAEVRSKFIHVNDVSLSQTHQQLAVEANIKDMRVGDLMNELSINIYQNSRWDVGVANQKPKFVVKDKIRFDNTGQLAIPAGKEYRIFDTRSLQSTTTFVKSIDLHDVGSDVILVPGRKNVIRSDVDFDGRFVVYNFDTPYEDEFNIRSDYSNVIFGLESFELLDEVYLLGPFNNWQIDKDYKMKYADGQGYYVGTLLKQGVYNYLYATKDVDGKADYTILEGDDHRTVNYYTTVLYYRDFTDQYDRVLATDKIIYSDQFVDYR